MQRRIFLRNTGLALSGMALSGLNCGASSIEGSINKFGLQLYTLRDDLPNDPKGVLKQVASFGYKQVEGYDGPQGLWWNMGHKEFKKYLDDLGLTMASSHCDTSKDFERKAGEASEIGLKYLLQPWVGPQNTLDDYKRIADNFNKLGDICKKNGIRFGYHNHGYSFTKMDGQYPQDIFMQNTNADTMDYEMDIYWVVVAGEDPIAWLKKYPNRFKLCHIKDRMKTAAAGEENASTDLGAGSIDFRPILGAAKEQGMEYYIVEQERYDNSTPLKSSAVGAAYMKKFKF